MSKIQTLFGTVVVPTLGLVACAMSNICVLRAVVNKQKPAKTAV